MSPRAVNLGRWAAVLPAALLAALLTDLAAALLVWWLFGGTQEWNPAALSARSRHAIAGAVFPFLAPFLFVAAGSVVAPSRRFVVALLLTVLFVAVLPPLSVAVAARFGVTVVYDGGYTWLPRILGGVAAVVAVWVAERRPR